ncbi:MAG: cytochrome P450 [Deltaproteobacteria bacterium]
MEFSPYAYEFHEDPYPIYRRLREEAPVYRSDKENFWALSRHADVLAGFKNSKDLSNSHGVSPDPSTRSEMARLGTSFLGMDPPEHTAFRSLVSRTFTPRRVAALEPAIRATARGYLDELATRTHFDLIDDFAGLLPMDVISEMLAVPPADRAELRRNADRLVHREPELHDVPPAATIAFAALREYFEQHIERLRRHPGDDLLSGLIVLAADNDILSDDQLLSFCNLFVVAGNETTTKLIGNAVYWLAKNPAERAKVAADPTRIPAWVEETLRFDNSTQLLMRLVVNDIEIEGTTIAAGEYIALLVGAANRDPAVFPNPEVFDLDRDTSSTLAFGKGTHFCLGASLARLEGRVALEEFWKRFPDYRIEETGIERVHSVNVRGFAHLPLRTGRG